MEARFTCAEQLVGNTPLMELSRLAAGEGLSARLLAKLESYNPTGSVKDRAALAMVRDAERRGALQPGGTIIEPTSGNTGISLAWAAATRGYRAIIVMPETMSVERRQLIAAYGAQVVLTPGALGMKGAVDRASQLAQEIPGSFLPGQFDNPANPQAHRDTTGPEIWRDTDGQVDVFVAGVGTGGTITGAGSYLKERNPALHVAAVEPAASPLLSAGRTGPHGIQGIGPNFLPSVLDTGVPDEIVPVTEQDAYAAARLLRAREGLMVGISSGAALWAALSLACRSQFQGKTIVVVLPDSGGRYLSTPLFSQGSDQA